MSSSINPLLPADGVPAVKADLRNNLQAAKTEIEALQARALPAGGGAGEVLGKLSAADFDLGWLPFGQPGVQDDGTQIVPGAAQFNFTGPGVTVSDGGGGVAVIDIPGGGGIGLDDVVRPEDHGAAGNGVANDTAAIVAAIAAARSAGKNLYFGAHKTYLITGRLQFTNWSGFAVFGNGATIKAANGMTLQAGPMVQLIGCADFRLLDLRIDGNRAARGDDTAQNLPSTNVHLQNCERWLLDGVESFNSPLDAFRLDAAPPGRTPGESARKGVMRRCAGHTSMRQGLSIIEAQDVWIDQNEFYGISGAGGGASDPQMGIDIEPNSNSGGPVERIWITRNLIHDCHGGGIHVTGPSAGTAGGTQVVARDIFIGWNQLQRNGGQGTTQNRALAIRSFGQNVWIVGNAISDHNTYNSWQEGRGIICASLDLQGPTFIIGNRIWNCDPVAHAIWIDRYVATAQRVPDCYSFIKDNWIDMRGSSNLLGAIQVRGRRRLEIRDNTVLGAGAAGFGIACINDNIACEKFTITGNHFYDLTGNYAIRAQGTGHIVDANVCRDCSNGTNGVIRTEHAVLSVSFNTIELANGGTGIVTTGAVGRETGNLAV